MATRIRFNPVTKEVEIEGSESFVERHFKRIQELVAPPKAAVRKEPAPKSARIPKTARKGPAKRPPKKILQRGNIFSKVIEAIKASDEGMTIDALRKKTGFTQQQVRSVIFRAGKQGVIQRAKRGVYLAAESK